MELELSCRSHAFYETAARLSAVREQTQEQVVPDARADILRIITAYGGVFVSDRSLADGRAEFGGVIRAAVLYLPESGEGVERVQISIPFSHAFEVQSEPDDLFFCSAELEGLDARTINPRKLLVRASVRVSARILRRREAELPESCPAPERLGVRTLSDRRRARVAAAATAKTFTISDTMEFGSGAAVDEIICQKLRLSAGDYNVVGRRVVFKATACVESLCRARGGAVFVCRSELPFSQILEPDGADENATIIIRLRPCDLSSTVRTEEGGRSFDLTFTAEAQAVAYAEREFDAICDLYSTAQRAAVECSSLEFEELAAHAERRTTVRATLETGAPPRDAEDAEIFFSQPTAVRGEGGAAVETTADLRVRYTAEDGAQYQARSRVPVRIEGLGDGEAYCELRAENVSLSAAGAGGVDVRFDAVADAEIMRSGSIEFVKSAKLEEYGAAAPPRPSVVLRYPAEGESLWQVAKRYCTTERDIREANGLGEDGEPSPDRLMLIPKRR